MSLPIISIITPTYNAEKTLVACLTSVAQQTYRPIEHWIVDGGSTDATLLIIEAFSQQYDHIRYESEPDRGIYDAMNKGITLAQGDWLYFLGGDDTLYGCEALTDVFCQENTLHQGVLYGNVVSTRFGGIYDGVFDGDKVTRKNICHQAIFFHKSVFLRIGNFDLRFKSHADWDHNLRWFLNPGIQRKYIPQTIARYADGGFSSMNMDAKFAYLLPSLALHYDQGSLSRERKVQLAKVSLRRSLRMGKVVQFLRHLLLYGKLTLSQ